ncbi:hypothetical protein Tco_0205023 [Tanacetum coccineum]
MGRNSTCLHSVKDDEPFPYPAHKVMQSTSMENRSFLDDEFLEPRSEVLNALAITDSKEEGWISEMLEDLISLKETRSWTLDSKSSWVIISRKELRYEETFAPVARLKAIRIFLPYAVLNRVPHGCQILGGKVSVLDAKNAKLLWQISSLKRSIKLLLDAVLKSSGSRVSWLTMMFSMTRYHFIRDHILKGNIELHFVPIDLQLADIFTKPLAKPSFTRLVAELEIEDETKTITFSLSWWDKTISFTQDEFISSIGLPICKDDVPLPLKETVRAGLGLEIDIRPIIFSDLIHKLQNRKKNKESDIFYTRFLSLIFENLLRGNYISNDLTLVKPHTITTALFQKPLASEVALTSYMLKVAKLFQEPEQFLIPPSGEVNADDIADKSLSRASMQPITQPKAPTDLKIKNKRIPPSSKPKSPYKVMVILPKKQVAETQHAEVIVATANTTKSLVASELAEEQVLDQNIMVEEDDGVHSMKEPTFEQLINEVDKLKDAAKEKLENDNVIDITPKGNEEREASEFGLCSMPDDDLVSLTGFNSQASIDHNSEEGTTTFHAFADMTTQSDPLGHLHEELGILNTKIDQLESSISKKVVEDMKSFIQDSIKSSVSESIAEELPQVDAQIQKNLQAQLLDLLLNPIYKEFNAFKKLESQRFVLLQKELSKFLYNKMRKSIRPRIRTGMKEVRHKLSACTSTVATNCHHVQDLRLMFHDMVSLLSAAEVFQKANAEGEKWEKNNPESLTKKKDAQHPEQTEGEQDSGIVTII